MDTNDINSRALEHACGEVFSTTDCLSAGDSTTNYGDVGSIKIDREFEMICNFTEPGFASRNGPDTTEWLILEVNALLMIRMNIFQNIM